MTPRRLAAVVVAAALAAAALAGCPRHPAKAPAPEPVAEPAPVEIDWPDAGG